jgi:hypothetical protein
MHPLSQGACASGTTCVNALEDCGSYLCLDAGDAALLSTHVPCNNASSPLDVHAPVVSGASVFCASAFLLVVGPILLHGDERQKARQYLTCVFAVFAPACLLVDRM